MTAGVVISFVHGVLSRELTCGSKDALDTRRPLMYAVSIRDYR